MSIELKQAAQQVLDAFEAFGEADDFATLFTLTQKMNALRTAIQQAEGEPCKSFTELRDRRREGVDAELAAMAAEAKTDEPVYWEWRHQGSHPDAVDFGQWSEWKRVEPRSLLHTVDDALREFKDYIARGSKYELRALYTHPAPGVPNDAARYALLRERFNKQKMSACQRIVEDLGLDGDPLDGLDSLVDKDRFNATQAQKSTDPQDTYVNGLAQANNEQD